MRIEAKEKTEYLLLYHCAPTLFKKKTANLFSLRAAANGRLPYIIHAYSRLTAPAGLKVTVLCSCERGALVYVYNEQLLMRILLSPEVKRFLASCGYGGCESADDYIAQLKRRCSEEHGFPHEIGIFLDYPLCDVEGFIKNGGKNFICCGDWKVYGEEQAARRRFEMYRRCRSVMSRKIEKGLSAREILASHQIKQVSQAALCV